MSANESRTEKSPSELIDGRIAELGDWRGETLRRLRALIRQAVPQVVEEWKWRGVPVWSSGRNHLYRRDLQGRREDDLREGGVA